MPADPIVLWLAAHDVDALALVAGLSAVIVLVSWAYIIWAVVKGDLR